MLDPFVIGLPWFHCDNISNQWHTRKQHDAELCSLVCPVVGVKNYGDFIDNIIGAKDIWIANEIFAKSRELGPHYKVHCWSAVDQTDYHIFMLSFGLKLATVLYGYVMYGHLHHLWDKRSPSVILWRMMVVQSWKANSLSRAPCSTPLRFSTCKSRQVSINWIEPCPQL